MHFGSVYCLACVLSSLSRTYNYNINVRFWRMPVNVAYLRCGARVQNVYLITLSTHTPPEIIFNFPTEWSRFDCIRKRLRVLGRAHPERAFNCHECVSWRNDNPLSPPPPPLHPSSSQHDSPLNLCRNSPKESLSFLWNSPKNRSNFHWNSQKYPSQQSLPPQPPPPCPHHTRNNNKCRCFPLSHSYILFRFFFPFIFSSTHKTLIKHV